MSRPTSKSGQTSSSGRPTSRSGSSGGGRPRSGGHGATTAKPQGHFSLGGLVENVGWDAKDMAFGLIPGLYEVGKAGAHDALSVMNPGRITAQGVHDRPKSQLRPVAAAIGQSYKTTYAPLRHGNFHPIYEHPLGPVLDALSLATLGAGAVVKGGSLAAKVGVLERAPLAARAGTTIDITGSGGRVLQKGLARTELRAQTQAARAKLYDRLPATPADLTANPLARGASRLVGSDARLARLERSRAFRRKVAMETWNQPYLKALSRLHGKDARIAAHLKMTLPLRTDLEAQMHALSLSDEPAAAVSLKLLNRPAVQRLYDAPPSKQMQAVMDEARTLGAHQANLLGTDALAAANRPYLHTLLSRGAYKYTGSHAADEIGQAKAVAGADAQAVTRQIREAKGAFIAGKGEAERARNEYFRLGTTRGPAEREAIQHQKEIQRALDEYRPVREPVPEPAPGPDQIQLGERTQVEQPPQVTAQAVPRTEEAVQARLDQLNSELDPIVNKIATGLKKEGLGKGARESLAKTDKPEYFQSYGNYEQAKITAFDKRKALFDQRNPGKKYPGAHYTDPWPDWGEDDRFHWGDEETYAIGKGAEVKTDASTAWYREQADQQLTTHLIRLASNGDGKARALLAKFQERDSLRELLRKNKTDAFFGAEDVAGQGYGVDLAVQRQNMPPIDLPKPQTPEQRAVLHHDAWGTLNQEDQGLAAAFDRRRDLAEIEREQHVLDAQERAIAAEQGAEAAHAQIAPLRAQLQDIEDALAARVAQAKMKIGNLHAPPGTTLEDMRAQARADMDAAGVEHPIYLPDQADVRRGGGPPPNASGGGLTPAAKTGAQKQNAGTLFHAGQLIMDPSVLDNSFLNAVKFAHYNDIHARVIANSRALAKGEKLPAGWRVVKASRSEPGMDVLGKTHAGFQQWADQYLDRKGAWTKDKEDVFTSNHLSDEDIVAGDIPHYRIVPEAFAKQMAGEFTKQGNLARMMQKYPIKVWRALVLNLRPAWLVNNIVGNTLMYLVHGASPNDLRGLATAMRKMVKPGEQDSFDRLSEKLFAHQVHGTGQETQNPFLYQRAGRARGNATYSKIRKGGLMTLDSLAAADKMFERALRSGKLRAELRRHPELNKRVKAMRAEIPDFHEAAGKVLSENPHMVDQLSDRINDALGDFNGLTPFEKNFARSAFPFYAWYRAITGVVFKMPLAQPVKTGLLLRLAQTGIDANLERAGLTRDDVPDNMRGFLTLGVDPDGRIRGISTGNANPYGTVGQLQDFVEALAHPGQAAQFLPGLNPIYAGMFEWLTGKNVATGAPVRNALPGQSTLTGLPQYRLGQAFGLFGGLYQGKAGAPTLADRDKWDELMRFMGVPYTRISPQRAKEIAQKNQGVNTGYSR